MQYKTPIWVFFLQWKKTPMLCFCFVFMIQLRIVRTGDLEGKTKKSKKTAYIQGSRRLNSKGYNVRKYTSQKRGMA